MLQTLPLFVFNYTEKYRKLILDLVSYSCSALHNSTMATTLSLLLIILQASSLCLSTVLDDYVRAPDAAYSYRALREPYKGDGFTTYYLNMTSQKWLTDADTSRSVWWHYLLINVPNDIVYPDHAFLWITGGGNDDGLPSVDDEDAAVTILLAATTGMVTAALFQVPNQPVIFTDDALHKHRSEDSMVAFTFYHFCNDVNNSEYVAYMPMTKAAVRAMDTVVEFTAEVEGIEVSKFMVSGASKRGWTTWLTGAVDKRVVAIIPIVMDELNTKKNLHHHYRAYGGWTWAFHDYYDLNFTERLDDPCVQTLVDFIDPLVYRDRLIMPKYIVGALGDEFFLPDDSNYYLDDLQGITYLRIIPNAEHSMLGHAINVLQSVRAFALSLLQDYKLPKVSWKLNQTAEMGYITVDTDTTPSYIKLWHASTINIGVERRDFRLLIGPDPHHPLPHPVLWLFENVTMTIDGKQFVGQRKKPDKGWEGFIIEMGFPSPDGSLFEITTQANIVPDTFPFPNCHGAGCKGTLV